MTWTRILAVIAVLTAASPASAEPNAPGALRLDYGYFCAVETVEQVEAEDTISGVVNMVAQAPPFIQKSTVVPGKIGIGFGIHLDVLPEYEGVAVVATVHPPMGPDGVTRETWVTTYEVGHTAYNGFTFEYDYELLYGPWTISAEANGRVIYKVDFTVVDPSMMPDVPCGGPFLS